MVLNFAQSAYFQALPSPPQTSSLYAIEAVHDPAAAPSSVSTSHQRSSSIIDEACFRGVVIAPVRRVD